MILDTTFTCPVCNYPHLEHAPYETWPPPAGVELAPPYEDVLGAPSYAVCPLCGFEFGNDDNPGTAEGDSWESYRERWIGRGRPPFAKGRYLADGFDPTRHGAAPLELPNPAANQQHTAED